ncbi:MAG: ABC transporter substrate-binding protein, partial [Ramlibacter sp.]
MKALAALLLALCCAAAAGAGPVTVRDDRGVEVPLPAAPRRIATLLPSLTETVCQLDACDRLVGVGDYSNWPARVQG